MVESFFCFKICNEGIFMVFCLEYFNVFVFECLIEVLGVYNYIIMLKLYLEYCLIFLGEKVKFLDDCVIVVLFEIF